MPTKRQIVRVASSRIVKTCCLCGEWKPMRCFSINSRSKDGHAYRCFQCCGSTAEVRRNVPHGTRKDVLSRQVCVTCGDEKPPSQFRWREKGVKLTSQCRSCWTAWRRQYRIDNPGLAKQEWDRDNLMKVLNLHGMSLAAYREIYEGQQGRCAICGGGPTGRGRLHIDHDHKTGKIRGLLCHGCNVSLGGFKDDVDLLLASVLYLETHNQKGSSVKLSMEEF